MLVISQEYPRLPYSPRRVIFKLPDYLLRDTAAPRLKIVVGEHAAAGLLIIAKKFFGSAGYVTIGHKEILLK